MKNELTIDQEIHQAVFSAQDNLLKKANSILKKSEIDSGSSDKYLLSKLFGLGFVNQKEVKKIHLNTESEKAKETIELINFYQNKYPKNRFIDEDSIKSICNRFGLLFAPVEMYNSEIPLKNKIEIIDFKCSVKDKCIKTTVSFFSKNASKIITGKKVKTMTTVSFLMPKIKEKTIFDCFKNPTFENELLVAQKLNQKYGTKIKWNDISNFNQDYVKTNVLTNGMIIAPKDKFIIPKNYTVENGFEVGYKKVVEIKDPVVLQPVIGGYLIVSAWGFEETLPEISGKPNQPINENLN